MNKHFANFLGSATYIPPESSGKDGYTVFIGGSEVYISNKDIDTAEASAWKMRTSFINEGNLYAMPIDMEEGVRQEEFNRHLLSCIQENQK